MDGVYNFEVDTAGWDEAWGALARYMDVLLGGNGGVRTAYQSLKEHCRADNQAMVSPSAKGLMRVVVEGGVAGDVDRCLMESRVYVGETWQYMGTVRNRTTGVWGHQFRHRHLDIVGKRVDVEFPCKTPIPVPAPKYPTIAQTFIPAPATTVEKFRDSGEPF